MLLKFFVNSSATAYLRGLAEEFDESTNAIRHELNNLSKAGYLISEGNGRTIEYRANTAHPLYASLKNLMYKYLGIDTIVENIVHKLGDLQAAYIIGDYARGKDSGTIEVLLVGNIDEEYLNKLVEKAQALVQRNIKVSHIQKQAFNQDQFTDCLLVWAVD